MTIKVWTALFVVLVLNVACAGSKMSATQPRALPTRDIHRLAVAPGSGVLGDAIGLELFNRGLTIVDAQETGAIVGRAGLREFEVTSTQGFDVLRQQGIDAVLTAKAVDGHDGRPESASVRVTDTTNGEIIAGLSWQNGWGGERGSMADRTMRKNLSKAASEIAEELLGRLKARR